MQSSYSTIAFLPLIPGLVKVGVQQPEGSSHNFVVNIVRRAPIVEL